VCGCLVGGPAARETGEDHAADSPKASIIAQAILLGVMAAPVLGDLVSPSWRQPGGAHNRRTAGRFPPVQGARAHPRWDGPTIRPGKVRHWRGEGHGRDRGTKDISTKRIEPVSRGSSPNGASLQRLSALIQESAGEYREWTGAGAKRITAL
jgi:hypothetical protein